MATSALQKIIDNGSHTNERQVIKTDASDLI